MDIGSIDSFRGNKIEILKMLLEIADNQLKLSCKINLENSVLGITFYNVSRLRFGELSMPLEVHGFEIINHSENGWENDSIYEIRDYEDDSVHFFCEYFKTGDGLCEPF